jgi:hypothetical protein
MRAPSGVHGLVAANILFTDTVYSVPFLVIYLDELYLLLIIPYIGMTLIISVLIKRIDTKAASKFLEIRQ